MLPLMSMLNPLELEGRTHGNAAASGASGSGDVCEGCRFSEPGNFAK